MTLTPGARLAEAVRSTGRFAKIEKGAIIFMEGLAVADIPLVEDGRVRVFSSSASGDEITLFHIGAGQTCVLAAASALTHRHYPATAVAETEVTAWLLPTENFLRLFGSDPSFQHSVFDLVTGRLATVMGLVGEVAFQPVGTRLAAYLLRRADGQGLVHETHGEIAANLGTAREVVSRLVKEMEKRNLVQPARGKIKITDPSRLAEQGKKV